MDTKTIRAAIAAALTIAASAVFPMATFAENASILLNGSFESYIAASNDAFTNTQLHAGMSATRHPNNWSYTSGAGLCASGDDPFLGGGNVPDGSIAVYLQSSGSISQSITVAEAGTYEVSFRYASRPGAHTNGCIYVKIVDPSNVETTMASLVCPVTVFRTAYAKIYLTPGSYTLKLEHSKGTSTNSGDSIIDRVEMKLMDNLISNGSFEDNVLNSTFASGYRNFSSTDYPVAWNWSGTVVFNKNTTTYISEIPDGDVAVAMRSNASLSQDVIAPTTGVYEVTLKYAKRPGYGAASTLARIYANIGGESLGYATVWTNAISTAHFYTSLEAG